MSLDTTIKALQGGLTELGVAKGVKNIDYLDGNAGESRLSRLQDHP